MGGGCKCFYELCVIPILDVMTLNHAHAKREKKQSLEPSQSRFTYACAAKSIQFLLLLLNHTWSDPRCYEHGLKCSTVDKFQSVKVWVDP